MACPPGHIQVRRDTTVNWLTKNPILLPGEFSYVIDGPRTCNDCSSGGIGPTGATGPSGPGFEFNGGLPGTDYSIGPTLNCGSVS